MSEATYLLDTNVFNHLIDGAIPENTLYGKRLAATSIQLEELKATPDQDRKEALIRKFAEIVEVKAIPPFAFDVKGAGWDESDWTDAPEFQQIRGKIEEYDRRRGRTGGTRNANPDALIAVAAHKHKFILVTNDAGIKFAVDGYVECEDWKI